MLTAANLGMEYWSYALRHAAYCDTFLSSSDSLPTPYSFWHGVLEKPRRNIAFGAPLLYRQQEKSKQHKLDARAHPAIFLGFANDHGAVRTRQGNQELTDTHDVQRPEAKLLRGARGRLHIRLSH